jgi:competence protein ComGC
MSSNSPDRRASEAGFTVIEGLVAALILAVILIGILPMVTRSMQNNIQGNDATYESNAVTDELDTLYSLPFNAPKLTITTSTSLVATDYFLLNDNLWSTTIPSYDQARYTRTSTVEYFQLSDLREDGTLDTPLDVATAVAGTIQVKRVTVLLEKPRTLGAADYQVVALKTN